MDDGYEEQRKRILDGLTAMKQFGMKLTVDPTDHADVFKEMRSYHFEDMAFMETDEELDGHMLLDYAENVVSFPLDDFELGEYGGIVERCVAVAGDAFPATEITETKLDRGYQVTWKVGDEIFKESGSIWSGTAQINAGVSGPARFYHGSWEMYGYLVFLTPEQAEMATKARGWTLSD